MENGEKQRGTINFAGFEIMSGREATRRARKQGWTRSQDVRTSIAGVASTLLASGAAAAVAMKALSVFFGNPIV